MTPDRMLPVIDYLSKKGFATPAEIHRETYPNRDRSQFYKQLRKLLNDGRVAKTLNHYHLPGETPKLNQDVIIPGEWFSEKNLKENYEKANPVDLSIFNATTLLYLSSLFLAELMRRTNRPVPWETYTKVGPNPELKLNISFEKVTPNE